MTSSSGVSSSDASALKAARSPRIEIDSRTFRTDRITRISHTLAHEPLLSLRKVCELARRRPLGLIRWHRGDIPVSTNFARAALEHANGRSLDQTLERMEEAGSWVFIQHIEEDPEYRSLVFDVLGEVKPAVEAVDSGMKDMHGWIFLSSPGATTPYHMDHEANFLVQIRGSKTINVWDPTDRSVVGELELETFHGEWSLEATKWKDEFQGKAHTFQAAPGTGVFMPFTAPHTVYNGPDVSITLSLTFLTDRTVRERELFSANHKLRKIGMSPKPVGSSPLRDEAKLKALHAWTSAKSLLKRGGGAAPRRSY